MPRPTVVCIAPVRNEAWIIGRFLASASRWADRIILADQGSTDGTREIARRFPKVRMIDNPGTAYDEHQRQSLLIAEARKIAGPRLLFSLDADEALSADAFGAESWAGVLAAAPGTTIVLPWVNLRPGLADCWRAPAGKAVAYADDGAEYRGAVIHGGRLPRGPSGATLRPAAGVLLHYQYADWERMISKHRWYQCFERLRDPERSAVDLYRQYHHMDAVDAGRIEPVQASWFAAYEAAGIDMKSIPKQDVYWYDREVLQWFARHGTGPFARQAVWDVDWDAIAGKTGQTGTFRDPRNALEKLMHLWLRTTQTRTYHPLVRLGDRLLKAAGW
ncbi:MAG: glycosyltransferase family 2 protein [Candidatus Edwardsbacteria bacterium]|jgi:glycosyltransferase involved in cell wall biosynthesis|nr:glycosyltransferase family 2 protein [Candidatus Edwardsbacteria bacterium]